MTQIPVICDQCRATGHAGEDPFADLADLLSFTPVPRRPHANGWTPEFQRGFIAALATTGSVPRSARAIGKHAFGAEQLRRAKGGSSFAAAWDAAIEIARERELAGLAEGLAELAAEQDEERQQRRSAILPLRLQGPAHPELVEACPEPGRRGPDSVRPERVEGRRLTSREEDDAEFEARREDYLAERIRIRERITRGRRLYLAGICDDPAKRAAWELLVGPVDWERAERFGPQDDEPFADPDGSGYDEQPHSLLSPAMLMTAEAGLLADITGGPDALAEFRRLVAENESAEGKADDGVADASPWSRDACPDRPTCGEADTFDVTAARDGSFSPTDQEGTPEEQAAVAAYRDELRAKGWTEDSQGNLWSPDDDQ